MRVVLAFVVAVLVTYIVAVLFYTQLNLGSVVEMGLPVPMTMRLEAAVHDLLGMTGLYLPIIGVALLLAFVLARLFLHWVPQLSTLAYIVAGFVGLFAVDAIMGAVFGMHPLAVTRTSIGLLSQCLAGAAGGYAFARLLMRTA